MHTKSLHHRPRQGPSAASNRITFVMNADVMNAICFARIGGCCSWSPAPMRARMYACLNACMYVVMGKY